MNYDVNRIKICNKHKFNQADDLAIIAPVMVSNSPRKAIKPYHILMSSAGGAELVGPLA